MGLLLLAPVICSDLSLINCRRWNTNETLHIVLYFWFDSTGWAVIQRKNFSLSSRRRNEHWVHIEKVLVARDMRNLPQLSLKVLFQRRAKWSSQQAETEFCTSSVQIILCSGQSVTYGCLNFLNEISTHIKWVNFFNSSWNGLDKQSSAKKNIIWTFLPIHFQTTLAICPDKHHLS